METPTQYPLPKVEFRSPRQHNLVEVFLGNLPYSFKEDDVRAVCRPSGEVRACAIHRGPNGQSKGSAFVTFEDVDGAEHFFQRGNSGDGIVEQGRRLTVDGRKPKKPKLAGRGTHDSDSVNLARIEVGFWLQQDVFVPRWFARRGGARVRFHFGRRELVLCFVDELSLPYEITIRFKGIRQKMIKQESNGLIRSLYIELKCPPKLHYKINPFRDDVRCTDLPKCGSDQPTTGILGSCLVYRLKLGREKGLLPFSAIPNELSRQRLYDAEEYRDVQRRPYSAAQSKFGPQSFEGIDDRLCYALSCLLSAGNVLMENFTSDLLNELRRLEHEADIDRAERALYRMYRSNTRFYDPEKSFHRALRKVGAEAEDRDIPAYCLWTRSAAVTPTRVLFFPPLVEQSNRVLRYWEKTKKLGSYFQRVSFVDEDFNQLYVLNGAASWMVVQRMERLLNDGFAPPVGIPRYEFLAFSASQLRETSCWFFDVNNPTKTTTEEIIKWMGDFSANKVVAKYAARIGQCFSSSKVGVTDVPEEQMTSIPDIIRNDYTFSDGVGKISRPLAMKIQLALGLDYLPSAFQIRFAGYKGVVVIDPSCDDDTKHLWWRPSMCKFESDHNVLEVLSHSKYLPGHLNHQVIAVMSSMGVPDSSFLALHSREVSRLEEMVSIPDRAQSVLRQQAAPLYSRLSGMLRAGFSIMEPYLQNCLQIMRKRQLKDIKQKARILVEQSRNLLGVLDETSTLESGQVFLQYSSTPLESLTTEFHRSEFASKHVKVYEGWVVVAKCPVLHPGDVRMFQAVDCPALHHVVDCLVFPQKGNRPHPNELAGSDLDGDLYFVSWDPSLFLPRMENHPAMDYTAAKPDQTDSVTCMSESDLDSYLDFVSWDPSLFLPHMENHPPMDDTAVKPDQMDSVTCMSRFDIESDLDFVSWDPSLFLPRMENHPVTRTAIITFFINFMQNNQLGLIANAHKVHADLSVEGVRDEKCIRLAQLHSRAVDFNKTGVPAEIPRGLRVRNFPDFMGKKKRYRSNQILGTLYRKVHLEEVSLARDVRQLEIDDTLLVKGYEDFVEEAVNIKKQYDIELTEIMNQHGVQTEAEAITGHVMKLQGQFKKGKKWFNLQQQLLPLTQHLHLKYRKRFEEEFTGQAQDRRDTRTEHVHSDQDRRKQKASAWYYVTYRRQPEDHESQEKEKRKRARGKKKPVLLLSFAWVMDDVLCQIKDQVATDHASSSTPSAPAHASDCPTAPASTTASSSSSAESTTSERREGEVSHL